MTTDVFISYNQSWDRDVAAGLRRGLVRFTKSWHRLGALTVYTDKVSQSATTDMRRALAARLEQSSWLVLLACPASAASPWVQWELRWWLEHKSADRIVLVITGGTVTWSHEQGDFDWEHTDALHHGIFENIYPGIPLWIDLRRGQDDITPEEQLRDAVATIASAVHGRPKEELYGEDRAQFRRTRQVIGATAAVLVTVLVVALLGFALADRRGRSEHEQRAIATARQLATRSRSLAQSQLDLSMLLAAQADRTHDDQVTRSTLFQSLTSSPELVRHLSAGSTVTTVATAPGTGIVAVGTQAGLVLRWDDVATGRGRRIADLGRPVTDLGISATGSVMVAASSTRAVRWTSSGIEDLSVPDGQKVVSIAVNGSGTSIAAVTWPQSAKKTETSASYVLDLTPERKTATRQPAGIQQYGTKIRFRGESEVVVLAGSGWNVRDFPALKDSQRSSFSLGNHYGTYTLTPDGRWFAFTHDSHSYFLDTHKEPSVSGDFADLATVMGLAIGDRDVAVAISPDGTRSATATGNQFQANVTTRDSGSPAALLARTTGASLVADDGLRFLNDNQVISANGDQAVLWDLRGPTRLGQQLALDVTNSCFACPVPDLVLNNDGTRAAVLDGRMSSNLRIGPTVTTNDWKPVSLPGARFSPRTMAWHGDDLYIITGGDNIEGGVPPQVYVVRDGFTPEELPWTWPSGPYTPGAIQISPDGRTLTAIDRDYQSLVLQIDLLTGREKDRHVLDPDAIDSSAKPVWYIAVSPEGRTIAWSDRRSAPGIIHMTDIASGQAYELHGSAPSNNENYDGSLAFAGEDTLVVTADDGTVEIWDLDQREIRSRLREQPPHGQVIASNDGRWAARRDSNNAVRVYDLEAGTVLGELSVRHDTNFHLGLALSDDGAILAAAGDGGVTVWSLDPATWYSRACFSADRPLRISEWKTVTDSEAPARLACH